MTPRKVADRRSCVMLWRCSAARSLLRTQDQSQPSHVRNKRDHRFAIDDLFPPRPVRAEPGIGLFQPC